MNVELLLIGKTDHPALASLMGDYVQRIGHRLNFAVTQLPDPKRSKNTPPETQRRNEAQTLLSRIAPGDYVVLLDERGAEYRSVELAAWLNKRMVGGVRHLVFIVGGPYGFDPQVYDRAEECLSLSKMTFSHQLVRLIFLEQLYRACTILSGEPYHHE